MLNTHGTVHGAILFSLADYVFASVFISYGKTSVGLTTTMKFMAPAKEADKLRAEAPRRKEGLHGIRLKPCEGELLARWM